MTGIANLLYGWHRYTDVWGQQKRVNPGWAHNPAKNLIRLTDDLTRFPDLDVLVVDVIVDLVLESANPLDPVNTISAPIYDFYSTLDQALTDFPNLNVSLPVNFSLNNVLCYTLNGALGEFFASLFKFTYRFISFNSVLPQR